MSIATKNGSIIVKDGKLAENCGCCGDWYCVGNDCGRNVNPSLIPWTCGNSASDIPPEQITLEIAYSGQSASGYWYDTVGATTYRNRTVSASQSLSATIAMTRSTFWLQESGVSIQQACCYRGQFNGLPVIVLPGVRAPSTTATPSPWQAGLGFADPQQFALQLPCYITTGDPEPAQQLPTCCMTSGACEMPDTPSASGTAVAGLANVLPDAGRGASFSDFAFAANGPFTQSLPNLRGVRWSFSMQLPVFCRIPQSTGIGSRVTAIKPFATFTVVG